MNSKRFFYYCPAAGWLPSDRLATAIFPEVQQRSSATLILLAGGIENWSEEEYGNYPDSSDLQLQNKQFS